ncbi:MAG: succinate dehydrogenase, cytochrome b556 subunit [Porticoccaceae bacterium]|nr:succinate dehydrogenase, cytochrome b556 subunit [Porticoccaceae bacterium]
MEKKRPMNLDLGTIRLPITSYVSILHRISGVIMFFAVAVLIWLFDMSLSSEDGYLFVVEIFNYPLAQIVIWSSLSALSYHISMGMRHLVMDFGFAEDFRAGQISAVVALLGAGILIVLLAGWIYI